MIEILISEGKIWKAFLAVEHSEHPLKQWLEAATNALKNTEYPQLLAALRELEPIDCAKKWLSDYCTHLEFRCAGVYAPVFRNGEPVTTPNYWFDNQIISEEEANLRRVNFLAGRKKYVKDKEITPLVQKEHKVPTKTRVFQYLEEHGGEADLKPLGLSVSDTTLEIYRNEYKKLNGTYVRKRAKRGTAEKPTTRVRAARGSGNQELVFDYLEKHGHDADLSHFNMNQGSAAVYRSLFRKAKGITVKRGRSRV